VISRLKKFRRARQPTAEAKSSSAPLEYEPPGVEQNKRARRIPLIILVVVEWVVVPLLLVGAVAFALWRNR
jgi:hypothetical protein